MRVLLLVVVLATLAVLVFSFLEERVVTETLHLGTGAENGGEASPRRLPREQGPETSAAQDDVDPEPLATAVSGIDEEEDSSLHTAAMRFQGRVTDAQGRAVEGALIEIYEYHPVSAHEGQWIRNHFSETTSKSDDQGRFEVSWKAWRPFGTTDVLTQLVATRSGFARHVSWLEPGEPELTIVLATSARLKASLRFLSWTRDEPPPLQVFLSPSSGRLLHERPLKLIDGMVDVPVDPGLHDLRVFFGADRDHPIREVSGLSFAAGQEIDLGTIDLGTPLLPIELHFDRSAIKSWRRRGFLRLLKADDRAAIFAESIDLVGRIHLLVPSLPVELCIEGMHEGEGMREVGMTVTDPLTTIVLKPPYELRFRVHGLKSFDHQLRNQLVFKALGEDGTAPPESWNYKNKAPAFSSLDPRAKMQLPITGLFDVNLEVTRFEGRHPQSSFVVEGGPANRIRVRDVDEVQEFELFFNSELIRKGVEGLDR